MAAIKTRDTALEREVYKYIKGLGWSISCQQRDMPGKPDFVIKDFRVVIFVNGCFWHQHAKCKKATIPKTNTAFWKEKLDKNRIRDKRVRSLLRKSGWNVVTLWECEIKGNRFQRKLRKYEMVGSL